jgi:hypothetical protein
VKLGVRVVFPKSETSARAKRKDYYVYFHRDSSGNIFYIGMGSGQRAWSTDRDNNWKRYVNERLNGRFEVEIVKDHLSESEAAELEGELIFEHGKTLVNWANPGRQFDDVATDRYITLRDENRRFTKKIQRLEKKNPQEALTQYRVALEKLREYESIVCERGLVAELQAAEPKIGDSRIIDGLTRCLVTLGRFEEAINEAEKYFKEFPGDRPFYAGQRTLQRIEELKSKL